MPGMNNIRLVALGFLLVLSVAASPKPGFLAEKTSVGGVPVVHLTDVERGIEVSILPSIGNMASEMKVHGKNILFFPEVKLSDFQKKPSQTGVPILAPWANRMDGTGFWANGKRYNFDLAMGNIRSDNRGLPIHGLLSGSVWEVTRVRAEKNSASVTSRFEFWKQPDLMAQWPFAHSYEMTYTLADGCAGIPPILPHSGCAARSMDAAHAGPQLGNSG